jgi:hypothetical protein
LLLDALYQRSCHHTTVRLMAMHSHRTATTLGFGRSAKARSYSCSRRIHLEPIIEVPPMGVLSFCAINQESLWMVFVGYVMACGEPL